MSEEFLNGARVQEVNDGPRSISSVSTAGIAIVGTAPNADPTVYPAGEPVLVAGDKIKAGLLDTIGSGAGTLPQALDGIFDQAKAPVCVVRVEEGADAAATQSNVIGEVDNTTDQLTGIQSILTAKNKVGFKPLIYCAPGFDHVPAVTTEIVKVAEQLKGFAYASGPNTNHADAIAFREQFGSKRLMIFDPWVKVWDTASNAEIIQPPSARIAGLRSKLDNDIGWHRNITNHILNGVVGIARDVDFEFGDTACKANLLNAQHVSTIVNDDGWRTWGQRTCASDPRWRYEQVVRTSDVIGQSIQNAVKWAIGEGITGDGFFKIVVESVQAYLDRLSALGMIVGGRCWAPSELNTPANIENGLTYFDFDFTPVYSNEKMTFRSRMVNNYLEDII